MPLKTFLNLSTQRQKEIIAASLEEFAVNSYDSASLTRIIRQLGLAKGSFYRYFENKQDLYIYLVEISHRIDRREILKYYKNPALDFFQAMQEAFLMFLSEEEEYPFYLQFSFRVSLERRYDILGELAATYRQEKDQRLAEIILYHQQRGELRRDIEVKKMIQYINYTVLGIREYLLFKYYPDGSRLSSPVLAHIPGSALKADLEEFISLLSMGIKTMQA